MILDTLSVLNSVRKTLRNLPSLQLFCGPRRQRLVRSYFFVVVILTAGGLVSAGLLEIYFRYSESLEHVHFAQQEAASRAAYEIERFIQEIATNMKAFTKSPDGRFPVVIDQYDFELKRLLFLAPAITEVLLTDADGIVKSQASRFRAVGPQLRKDLSQTIAFQRSKNGQTYFGMVYFRDFAPCLTVAVPVESSPGEVTGVLLAETSLRDILDVVSAVRFGGPGYKFVITRSGELIAHSNVGLVLQRRNLAVLSQVKSAFQSNLKELRPKVIVTSSIEGHRVFSSYALIPILDWAVFIERPTKDTYAPIYASLLRTSVMLMIGLGLALLASVLVARRVVRPLETLRLGAEQIGSGNLNARLEIKTGDEIEILADEFNKMAAHLREAYAGLERKVAERTRELTVSNSKLEEASRVKSQFLANVNHELRTPVSAIITYAGLVLRETEGQISQLQKENLQDLLKNAERLLNLIDGLLDIATIEAGKLDVRLEPIDLEEIILEAVSAIESTVNRNHVRIIRNLAGDLTGFSSDSDKLRQIILNLLDNAAKFTERGVIRISAFQQNGVLKLVVSDTGIGIRKEDMKHIFEEFGRGKSSSTKRTRGTGLGLAIAKRLAGLLGGTIDVSSKVGEGSTFTVTLPLDYQARAAAYN